MVIAYVEEAVSFQTEWLVDLKIEADCFHSLFLDMWVDVYAFI